MTNWLRASFQLLMGRVHFFDASFRASHSSLKTALSLMTQSRPRRFSCALQPRRRGCGRVFCPGNDWGGFFPVRRCFFALPGLYFAALDVYMQEPSRSMAIEPARHLPDVPSPAPCSNCTKRGLSRGPLRRAAIRTRIIDTEPALKRILFRT